MHRLVKQPVFLKTCWPVGDFDAVFGVVVRRVRDFPVLTRRLANGEDWRLSAERFEVEPLSHPVEHCRPEARGNCPNMSRVTRVVRIALSAASLGFAFLAGVAWVLEKRNPGSKSKLKPPTLQKVWECTACGYWHPVGLSHLESRAKGSDHSFSNNRIDTNRKVVIPDPWTVS